MNPIRLVTILFVVGSFAIPLTAFVIGQGEREVVILAVNDVYRIEGVDEFKRGGMGRIRALRQQLEREAPDLLFLHAGDFLFPSLLSDWSNGSHMIKAMNMLDGAPNVHDSQMLVVPGNHEFDKTKGKDAENLQQQMQASEFDWLGSNIRFTQEKDTSLVASEQLKDSVIRESGGVRVGIFGLTTNAKPAKDIEYVDEFVNPVHMAKKQTHALRMKGAELVIALTHLAIKEDREILEKLGNEGPDLIIGGHEHERHHVEIDGRWIVKADADARTAAVVRVHMGKARPSISLGYRFLDDRQVQPDPTMQQIVDTTLKEHDVWFCTENPDKKKEKPGCLDRPVGETSVPLIGEELEIRRYETNLGNWVTDQARAAFENADIAFINGGSLRLNQDIPTGPITRRYIEELLPYENELVQIKLDENKLRKVLERATEDWTGEGHWLQISGFAFEHNPGLSGTERVGKIKLLRDEKISTFPDQPITAVTNKYLCIGKNGYKMLEKISCEANEIYFKEQLLKTLREIEEPIKPKTEGRICNVLERNKRPCKFKS